MSEETLSIKVNKYELYNALLEQVIVDENYESAAIIRDYMENIDKTQYINLLLDQEDIEDEN